MPGDVIRLIGSSVLAKIKYLVVMLLNDVLVKFQQSLQADLGEAIIIWSEFGYKINLLLYSDLGSYVRGEEPDKKKLLKNTLGRVSCLLCAIRFGICAYIDTPLVRATMVDFTYTFNNHQLVCILLSWTGI